MHLPKMFSSHVRKNKLLKPGQKVLVAWSGGADSTALLHLLMNKQTALKLGRVAVAHLDHKLREEAHAERTYLDLKAARLGLDMLSDARDVVVQAGESLEAAARRVRYTFLAEAIEKLGCDVLVTAHHMDDQAETVLYGLLRGTDPNGFRRIRETFTYKGVQIVRPLLPFRRADLREWLTRNRITWCEDASNVNGNDRAKIRNVVIPTIVQQLHRDPVGPLAEFARKCNEKTSD